MSGRLMRSGRIRRTLLLLFVALADFAAGEDVNVGVFFRRAALLTFARGLAPERTCATMSAASTAFTTTVRVIHWVHRGAAHGGANTHFARASRLADYDQAMFVV